MTPLRPDRSGHLLSRKRNTVMNASVRRMAALITFLLWQTVLVALAFPLLFILESTAAANLDEMKAWWIAGLSSCVEDVPNHCPHLVGARITLSLAFRFSNVHR